MEALQQAYGPLRATIHSKRSIIHQFLDWCTSQEKNRLLWVAVIITGHGCIITPITALLVVSTGNNILFLALTIGGMAIPLVTNLAAMPTKVTIPVFFVSLLIDFMVVIGCLATLANGMN